MIDQETIAGDPGMADGRPTTIAEMRNDPQAIAHAFESGEYPYRNKMRRAAYEKHKAELQVELLKVQEWVKDTGQKVIVLFEGRDAAGKGGTIKRFMEHLNPRGARVVALEKPSERESSQWYFQRYVEHLPAGGEIVMFDRSWYNRAGVERVMGFCSPNDYLEFMRQTPDFERMLVRSDIRLFKFWFSVTRDEQLRRFQSRGKDPLKQWKLSHRHGRRAVDGGQVERQEARPRQLHAALFVEPALSEKGPPDRARSRSADRRPFGTGDRQVGTHSGRDAASRHEKERLTRRSLLPLRCVAPVRRCRASAGPQGRRAAGPR